MKLLFTFVILNTVILQNNLAQGLRQVCGANAHALSGISTLDENVWSANNNQGALGFINKKEVGIFMQNKFGLADVNNGSFAFVSPIKNIVTALQLKYFGNSYYNEMKTGLAIGMKIGKKFSLGFAASRQSVTIANYGSSYAIIFEGGTLIKPSENTTISFHTTNPFQSSLQSITDLKIESNVTSGIKQKVSSKINLLAELTQTFGNEITIRSGIQYTPNKNIELECGTNISNPSLGFGFSWIQPGFRFEFSVLHVQYVGLSSQFSIVFYSNKK